MIKKVLNLLVMTFTLFHFRAQALEYTPGAWHLPGLKAGQPDLNGVSPIDLVAAIETKKESLTKKIEIFLRDLGTDIDNLKNLELLLEELSNLSIQADYLSRFSNLGVALSQRLSMLQTSLQTQRTLIFFSSDLKSKLEKLELDHPLQRRMSEKWKAIAKQWKGSEEVESQLRILQTELTQFLRNIAEDERLLSRKGLDLEGINEGNMRKLKTNQLGDAFDLSDPTTYVTLLSFAKNETTRRLAYQYRTGGKARKQNEVLARKIAKRRKCISQECGFSSFTAQMLSTRYIKDERKLLWLAEEASSILDEQFQLEKEIMLEMKKKDVNEETRLHAWDALFYIKEAKDRLFSVNPEEVDDFFPTKHTIRNSIRVISDVFGDRVELKFVEGSVLDGEEMLVEVRVEGELVGHLILDLFRRAGKHSWPQALPVMHGRNHQGKNVSLVGMSLSPGAKTLTVKERETLFHEIGHGLGQILGRDSQGAPLPASIDGTTFPVDVTEFYSHLLQRLSHDPRILHELSYHKTTGEKIPQELLDRMKKASVFGEAHLWRRQIPMIIGDLMLHGQDLDDLLEPKGVKRMEARLNEQHYYPVEGIYILGYLEHLYAPSEDYAGGGYSSYLIARMMESLGQKLILENLLASSGSQLLIESDSGLLNLYSHGDSVSLHENLSLFLTSRGKDAIDNQESLLNAALEAFKYDFQESVKILRSVQSEDG